MLRVPARRGVRRQRAHAERFRSGPVLCWLGALLCLGLGLLATGCATIGPATPLVSAEVGKRIADMQGVHEQALRRYFESERARVESFLKERWVPLFLKNFVASSGIVELVRAPTGGGSRCEEDTGALLIEWAADAQAQIDAKRRELLDPLLLAEQSVLAELAGAYAELNAAQSLITARLEAAADLKSEQDRLLEALKIDARFDSVKGKLSGLSSGVGAALAKAESATDTAEMARSLGDGLRQEAQKLITGKQESKR